MVLSSFLIGIRYRLLDKIGKTVYPFIQVLGFFGPEVDPQCSETDCTGRLGSTTEDIRSPGDLEIDKSGRHDCGL